jgi:uncharacterized membrane protein YhaH (DUF805 family)
VVCAPGWTLATCPPATGSGEDGVTSRIFINYRRSDSPGAAGRLYDRLQQHFERNQVFMDVDAIEPGIDFVKSLDEQVSTCGAFIAVIGPDWLATKTSDGRSRLHEPTDYVRVEIESALKRDIRVIPVLVDGAIMPRPSDLPPSIEALARRNAVEIAHHRFAADCDSLAGGIKRALGIAAEPSVPVQPVGSLSPQDRSARALSWIEVFFSFRGRISRKQFLLGLISILAVWLALIVAILVTADSIFGNIQADDVAQKLELFKNRLFTILEIAAWWPTFALTLKRLHDLEHGWKTFLIFVACDVTVTALDLLGKDEASNQLLLFQVGILFMLAAIKGTTGPNKYGPDPLAKPPSSPRGEDKP